MNDCEFYEDAILLHYGDWILKNGEPIRISNTEDEYIKASKFEDGFVKENLEYLKDTGHFEELINDYKYHWYDNKIFEGIKLSEDILLANGFLLLPEGVQFDDEKEYKLSPYCETSVNIILNIHTATAVCQIRLPNGDLFYARDIHYVHELQDLFRHAMLIDGADNFTMVNET